MGNLIITSFLSGPFIKVKIVIFFWNFIYQLMFICDRLFSSFLIKQVVALALLTVISESWMCFRSNKWNTLAPPPSPSMVNSLPIFTSVCQTHYLFMCLVVCLSHLLSTIWVYLLVGLWWNLVDVLWSLSFDLCSSTNNSI